MHRCPVCQAKLSAADPDVSFAFGIVLRDVVPMEKLAPLLCPDHEILMLTLFEMLVDQSTKYNEALAVPDKEAN